MEAHKAWLAAYNARMEEFHRLEDAIGEERRQMDEANIKYLYRLTAEVESKSVSILEPDQQQRLDQIIRQYALGRNHPLVMYANQAGLQQEFDLPPQVMAELGQRARDAAPEMRSELRQLLIKYHNRLCADLVSRKRELLLDLLWSDGTHSKQADSIIRDDIHSPDRVPVWVILSRINGLGQTLELTDEQWLQVGDIRYRYYEGQGLTDEDKLELQTQLLDYLLPHQLQMLAQLQLNKIYNQDWPLGVYRDEKVLGWAGLDAKEQLTVSRKSETLIGEFDRDWTQLQQQYHEQIRAVLDESQRQQMQDKLGTPLVLDPRRFIAGAK